MWNQNTFGLSLVLAGLLCTTTPILGQGENALSATGCVLNTREANPLNDQTYFQCTTTGFTLMRCPETMVFEANSSSCVKVDLSPMYIYVPYCARLPVGTWVPSYCNCGKFWRCVFQYSYLFSCPEGTLWNQKILTCDFPYNVNCKQNPGCTENDIKTEVLSENIQYLRKSYKDYLDGI